MAEAIEWMRTADAAEYLGVTLRTVYRFIDDGQIPAYKFGRVIRVKADDVRAFVEASRIEPGSLQHLHPEPAPGARGGRKAVPKGGTKAVPRGGSSASPQGGNARGRNAGGNSEGPALETMQARYPKAARARGGEGA